VRPIFLSLSGGIDSEVMALAFKDAGVEFTAVILEHSAGTNQHDVYHAKRLCDRYNIKQHAISVDIKQFYQYGIEKYIAQGYQAMHVFRYLQLLILDHVESLGGCAVLGGGDQLFSTVGTQIGVEYNSGHLVSLEWIKNNNTLHFPYFHQTTPCLIAAYYSDPLIKIITADHRYYISPVSAGYSAEKALTYHAAYPEMLRRQKYDGDEKIFDFRNGIQDSLIKRFGKNPTYWISADNIRIQLGI